ncbi:hypothetical protein OLZ32_27990 [Rhizobium sp. 1AS11]|uniref:hypothetical protein n=1 Tax=Rhizobium acaciae TaxID=2989736 RepID=UPI002222DC33|nr:hypothetical protein [Rhizobium acaciae]MCW1412195.1 hypothetical protein [Rhizobium acaciae]MCW1744210.1 hypothetical protein [Rhizobium acaciae]
MTDIPEDIMKAATDAAEAVYNAISESENDPLDVTIQKATGIIAAALNAEREAAARYLESIGDHGDQAKADSIRNGEHRA